MIDIQFIERDGHREYAVVPIEIWDKVKDLIEDLDDAAALKQAVAEDDGTRIPHTVLKAELAGDHPIKAWREHRGITQDALASAVGISKPYLSQMENRKRDGSVDVLQKLAAALEVPMDLLVEQD